MTKLVPVDFSNSVLLETFLQSAGSSLSRFRYYSTRDILSSLKNHKVTYLLFEEEDSVAYGHLDYDGTRMWLGLCVKENYLGRGYGKCMMNAILSSHNGEIFLSVDASNTTALALYQKFGFEIIGGSETVYYMRKHNDTNLQTVYP